MSGYSDIIKELSTTTPLLSATSWTSEKIIAGQYSSMTISYATDQDSTILTSFSNDGTNFDINVSKSIYSGSGYENIVILGKWIRVRITNNALSNQTYLRIYTYGSVNNNSLNALIQKVGNLSPEISIDNLPLTAFGELSACENRPSCQYNYVNGTTGDLATQAWKLPYLDIKSYCNTTKNLMISNGVMKFGGLNRNQFAIVYGSTYRYRPGQGIVSRFTGYFEQGLKDIGVGGNYATTEYIGVGNIDSATSKPLNGYFFGYGDVVNHPVNNPPDNFGIVYLNNGTRTFYPKTLWNVDKCDGTYIMPVIDFTKMNVFQISFQYLGFGIVNFFIENPQTGLFQLVHTINRTNQYTTPSNLGDPSVGMIMYMELEPEVYPTTVLDFIGSSSFMLAYQGPDHQIIERLCVEASKTGISSETALMSIRCDTTFYGKRNNYPIDVDYLSAACEGTKPVRIRLYINATLGGSVWTTPNSNLIPFSYDTTGSISVSGRYIFGFMLGKSDNVQISLDSIHQHLNYGDTLTITAESTASTDIFISASVHVF